MIGPDVDRAALVVAHPDDETLWCGGLLLRHPAIDWTVIACSIPRRDPERAWKFYEACAELGAQGRVLPVQETEATQPLGLDLLDLSGFDLVVTHGAAGEYGHPHHRQVHRVVRAMVPARLLAIGWRPGGGGTHWLALQPSEVARKLAALRCYDHRAPLDDGKPKWQALLDRYVDREGLDFGVESYDVLA